MRQTNDAYTIFLRNVRHVSEKTVPFHLRHIHPEEGSNCIMIGFRAAVRTDSLMRSSNSTVVDACSMTEDGVVNTIRNDVSLLRTCRLWLWGCLFVTENRGDWDNFLGPLRTIFGGSVVDDGVKADTMNALGVPLWLSLLERTISRKESRKISKCFILLGVWNKDTVAFCIRLAICFS